MNSSMWHSKRVWFVTGIGVLVFAVWGGAAGWLKSPHTAVRLQSSMAVQLAPTALAPHWQPATSARQPEPLDPESPGGEPIGSPPLAGFEFVSVAADVRAHLQVTLDQSVDHEPLAIEDAYWDILLAHPDLIEEGVFDEDQY